MLSLPSQGAAAAASIPALSAWQLGFKAIKGILELESCLGSTLPP